MSSERTREVYLIVFRPTPSQRAHFAIWVPSADNPDRGTQIHVVGAPMAGFNHEFKRQHNPKDNGTPFHMVLLGLVSEKYIADINVEDNETKARDDLERAALACLPPRVSKDIRAPVNDVDNKRCQEWTMEFLRYLVSIGFINSSAISIAQANRDPPDFGIGLKPVGEGAAAVQQASPAGSCSHTTVAGSAGLINRGAPSVGS